MDKDKLIEWIDKNFWTGDSGNSAGDYVSVVDADDLRFAIQDGEFDDEPCEYCKNIKQLICTMPFKFNKINELEFKPIEKRFCPSCGRDLRGGE